MPTNLDETEFARLEALSCAAGAGEYSAHDEADDSAKYAAAACNAVPVLVAEVRRLREALNKEHRAWQCAEGRGDGLEMENAALREKVEAWEWFEEVRTYDTDAFHPYREHKYANPYEDKKAKAYGNAYLEWAEMWHAARESVHVDE